MEEEPQTRSVAALFRLDQRVAVITGGAGLLGAKHAEAIAEMGGIPVLVDIQGARAKERASQIERQYAVPALGFSADVTRSDEIVGVLSEVLDHFGRIDILVNNAAHNPAMGQKNGEVCADRFEQFALERWSQDMAVGLTGAFLCCQVIGTEMARRGHGVILNIASDLAIIAPDQRIYRQEDTPPEKQPVKPVTYSIVKHGLIGLTRYLATYWAEQGVRVNALSPGGVYAEQDQEFVERLTRLIPLGRMAHKDEYKAAVVFLVSEASSYMTGANLIIDGGRTAW